MKRLTSVILAVLVSALLTATLFAQGLTGKGAKVGLNIASWGGKHAKDIAPDSRMGFALGGFITYTISDNFAIQPEILYTRKGAKQKIDEVEEDPFFGTIRATLDLTATVNYLEIPILARLTIPTQGGLEPYLFAGPALSIKLNDKLKSSIKLTINGEPFLEFAVSQDADVKSTDFGLVLGAGAAFPAAQGKLTVDARYTLGLTSLQLPAFEESEEGEEGQQAQYTADVKNRVISVMVGYSF